MSFNTKSKIEKSLTQFILFTKYFRENDITDFQRQPWYKNFDHNFFNSEFFRNIVYVQNEFIQWLNELENQNRKFTPFELNNGDNLLEIIKGLPQKKGIFAPKFKYRHFDDALNKLKNIEGEKDQKLVEFFYSATQNLIKEKFNII